MTYGVCNRPTELPESSGPHVVKVISGGQTGVDRAALDAALDMGFACGGWCPRGRLAEDGTIPSRYPMREAPSANYPERTTLNVRDADGTLILAWGTPTDGTALTIHLAETMEKPCLVLDLVESPDPERAREWVRSHSIRILNVAGPRASASPKLQPTAYRWMVAFLSIV